MRFGLIGTGTWAREAHAAALAAAPEAEFVGLWGRDPGKATALADVHGVRAFPDVDALLDEVDAVSFAVPPAVQSPLAVRAARAGKHLLLEKPLGLSTAEATAVSDAVDAAGVSSLVFFTRLFTPEGRAWLHEVRQSRWELADSRWLYANFASGSRFDSPWRREKGALWDVGPHVVAVLTAALGRVGDVTAVRGLRDVLHLTLRHDSGATSSAVMSISVATEAAGTALTLSGPGRSVMPARSTSPGEAAAEAVRELVTAARAGQPVRCDVRFGAYVTGVLARAEAAASGYEAASAASRSETAGAGCTAAP